jgi:hypothetical protein
MKINLQNSLFFLTLLFFQILHAQNALDFDGTDDKVDCGNDTSIRITGKLLSIEAWIYPIYWKTNVFDGNVVNKEYNTSNYGFMLRVGDGGKLNFAIGDGSWHELTSSSGILSLNTWQHIAGTYDGKKMRIYLNGVAVDSLAETAAISDAISTPVIIGGHTTYTRFYQGVIDEVRIWKKCLSEKELNTSMQNEFCSRTPELRAYYKFNQGKAGQANTTLKRLNDLSGYGNHGTLVSFFLSGTGSNWVKGKSLDREAVYSYDTVSVCDRYTGPSRKYTWTKSGNYTDTLLTAVMGCDSVIAIQVKIRKSTASNIRVYACNSYVSPSGKLTWTKSGVYTERLVNADKCDSVVTVVLKIGGSRDTTQVTVCNSYKFPAGKRTYTSSGIYSDTLKGYMGCDSIFVTKLTVLKRSYVTRTEKVCNAFPSPSGRYIYNKSGTYNDTIKNVSGCDSVITFLVQILRSTGNAQVNACNRYISPSGNEVWTSSGTYTDIMVNAFGCDSVITVHLTIARSSAQTITATACRTYVSPSKKHVWRTPGIYRDTLVNDAGCDSVITVNLSITPVNVNVSQSKDILTAENTSATYQWLDCNKGMAAVTGETSRIFKAKVAGDYAVAVVSGNCSDTSACYNVSQISGINELRTSGFTIVPNPGAGDFNILMPQTFPKLIVSVWDISGRLVYEQVLYDTDHSVLSLRQPDGLYFVQVSAGDYRETQSVSVRQ